jgi:hypothetical protein
MDPKSELTFRMICPPQLEELLANEPLQETYFTEIVVDRVALDYERKRVIPRPLSPVDREYLSGRMSYCVYSPSRIDFGPVSFFVRQLLRDATAEGAHPEELLLGGIDLRLASKYGKVQLFRAPEIANNAERLRQSQYAIDSTFEARQVELKLLAMRVFHRDSIDLSELKQSIESQMERLRKFLLRSLEQEKLVLEYVH